MPATTDEPISLPCNADFFLHLAVLLYGRCQWCGRGVTRGVDAQSRATRDHLIPRSRGGPNRVDNLVLACTGCNNLKGSRTVWKIPLRGPRWRQAPDGVAAMAERPVPGFGGVWLRVGDGKWRKMYSESLEKCQKQARTLRRLHHGQPHDLMILPNGAVVRDEHRQDAAPDRDEGATIASPVVG